MSTRRAAQAQSRKRKVNEVVTGIVSNNETGSNADTCCLGKNWIVCEYTTRTADVFPYDDSYEPITNVPIVSGTTAYTNDEGWCSRWGTNLMKTFIMGTSSTIALLIPIRSDIIIFTTGITHTIRKDLCQYKFQVSWTFHSRQKEPKSSSKPERQQMRN